MTRHGGPMQAHDLLLGLAAGDRIGGPTRMAILLAESLANRQAFDLDDIARRYADWWQAEGFDTGPTSDRAFALLNDGIPRTQASQQVDKAMHGQTAGCNPAHRATPIALCSFIPGDAACADQRSPESTPLCLAEAAKSEARLTHYHPLAGDVSAAAVQLCHALLVGKDWVAACEIAATDRLPETTAAFETAGEAELSPSGFAPDVLKAAVWFVGQSTSLDEAVKRHQELTPQRHPELTPCFTRTRL